MGTERECKSYDDAVVEINATPLEDLNWKIARIKRLLSLAEQRKLKLESENSIEAIRERLEQDKANLCDTTRQRFKDIETLLEIIDSKGADK